MKITLNQKRNIFFTSDTHFHHKAILKYTSRPFQDIEDMNEQLISRWNAKIHKDDTVIHTGDFSFGTVEEALQIFARLNGKIYLAKGNHDSSEKLKKIPFEAVGDVLQFRYNGKGFFASHFAHRVWEDSHYHTYHIYGHSHGSLPDDPNSLSMDVGIDCHPNCEPFSFEEVREKMKAKNFIPVDHHAGNI
jgi:calcineurin-like phosphoesterase family protein